MALGTFQDYFIPVLSSLKKNGVMHRKDNMSDVVKQLGLSAADLELKTSRGTPIYRSRLHWAQAFLAQAGAVTRPQRGYLQITERGEKLLIENPDGFSVKKFKEFPDYADAWGRNNKDENQPGVTEELEFSRSPQEIIEAEINKTDAAIGNEILRKIQNMPFDFLEKIVLKLLTAMGYGDSESSIQHLGKSGDEGVDGVINQDVLGLQRVYVQAKRNNDGNTIGRPEIQKFVGALSGLGASGGVFITTSKFSNEAKEYVSKNMTQKVVLIDGFELGQLMVKYGIGVQITNKYQIVEVDEDFFEN
jgi:restriction system protein